MRRMSFFQLFLVAVSAYALLRGGRAERLVAALFGAAYLATIVLNAIAADNYESPQWSLFALDLAVAVGLLRIATGTPKRWSIWMLAMQLMAVADHAARLASPATMNWIYYALTALLGYPMLGLLAWAIWQRGRNPPKSLADAPSIASWLRLPRKKD